MGHQPWSTHNRPTSPQPPLPSHPLLTARIIQEQDVIQAEIATALAGNHCLEEDLRHRTEGSRLARGGPLTQHPAFGSNPIP